MKQVFDLSVNPWYLCARLLSGETCAMSETP